VPTHDHEGSQEAGDEAAVPGEARTAQMVPGDVGGILEQVVDLGADEPPKGGPHDQGVRGVAAQSCPVEGAGEQVRADQRCEDLARSVGLDVDTEDREQDRPHEDLHSVARSQRRAWLVVRGRVVGREVASWTEHRVGSLTKPERVGQRSMKGPREVRVREQCRRCGTEGGADCVGCWGGGRGS